MSDFTISDLENLKKLREDLNETFDCLENIIDQVRDFNRKIHNLEEQKTQKHFKELIDKGLIPGAYFQKDDSPDVFKITGIGIGHYLAVNISTQEPKEYIMPIEHYLTGESMAHRYTVCSSPEE